MERDTFLDLLAKQCQELQRVLAAEYRTTVCNLEEEVQLLSAENSQLSRCLQDAGGELGLELSVLSRVLEPTPALTLPEGRRPSRSPRHSLKKTSPRPSRRMSASRAGSETLLAATAPCPPPEEPAELKPCDGQPVGRPSSGNQRKLLSQGASPKRHSMNSSKRSSKASIAAAALSSLKAQGQPTKVVPYSESKEETSSKKSLEGESSDDESAIMFSVSDVWASMLTRRKSKFVRTSMSNLRGSTRGSTRLSDFLNIAPSGSSSLQNHAYAVQPTWETESKVQMAANWAAGHLMMEPNSLAHLVWEALSFIMIIYDLITVPLEAFDPPISPFTDAMLWVVRIFWTIDIGANFLTGYLDGLGRMVLLPGLVARRYAMRQLHLDLLVVGSDWAEELIGIRATGVFKSWRMLRILRLLRLKKAREIIELLSEHIRSERLVVFASISKMLILLVTLSHLIGCCMYLVRTLDAEAASVESEWLPEDAQLRHRYMQSFHFAIGLFFGEHVLVLQTIVQRLFTSICLAFTFTLQIWFVSFITTAMTHFEIISTERSSKFAALSRFMNDHFVPREVALKVERNAKHALAEQARNAPESSIALLELISDPLMMELHFEMHMPTLRTHPFLRLLADLDPIGMRKVCHSAIKQANVAKHDVLFVEGECPESDMNGPRVLFIAEGELVYLRQEYLHEPVKVGSQHWVSEAALWTKDWIHCGTLRAMSDSRLLSLDVRKFQEIVRECPQPQPASYAVSFVNQLNRVSPLDEEFADPHTDVGEYTADLAELLTSVFAEEFAAVRHEFDTKAGIMSKVKSGSRLNSNERFSQ